MEQHHRVTVYSAESRSSSFLHHLKDIVQELPEAHQLGLRLFKRNIKAMYRQSLLGITWALFPPLITAALWMFLRGSNVMEISDTGIPYPIFVLTGTMLWQIFTESVQAPIKNVVMNKSMLVKINIPREGLLLSGIYEIMFNTFIKLVLLTAIFIFFGQHVNMNLLMVPVGILAITICGFSIGLILTPIGMLYQDIQRGLSVALPFLMFLTPIIYPKPQGSGALAMIMKINPMANLIPETRNWFTAQPTENLQMFWIYAAAFFFLLVLGLVIYRLSMPMIIERAGS